MNAIEKTPSWVDEQATCAICQEDFKSKEWVRKMTCLHLFHSNCVNDWIKRTNNCPTCRETVEQSRLKPSYRYITKEEKKVLHKRQCLICKSFYADKDMLTELKCQHLFHQNCLSNCQSSNQCPLCAEKIQINPALSLAKLVTLGCMIFATSLSMAIALYEEKNLHQKLTLSKKIDCLSPNSFQKLSFWAPLYLIIVLSASLGLTLKQVNAYKRNQIKNFRFSRVTT